MLQKILLSVLITLSVCFTAKSQLLTDQCESLSPCNAIPICGTSTIVNNFSYTTTMPNNPIGTCLSFSYGGKWMYYKFTCSATGIFRFRLTPNDSATVNSDLDWALWNITTSTCAFINNTNVVACNAGLAGPTGINILGIPTANFSPDLNMLAGTTYILGISNPNGTNTNGFTLSFDGTTASLIDNKKPFMSAVLPYDACQPITSIQIKLSEPVRCDQLGVGTDFVISGPVPSFVVSPSSNCSSCTNAAPNLGLNYSKLNDTATLTFASALAPGVYTITASPNAFYDACGNSDSTQATLTFTVPSALNVTAQSGFNCTTLKYIDTVFANAGSSPYQYKAVGGGLSAAFGTYGTPTASTYSIYTVSGGLPVTYTVKDIFGCESDITLSRPSIVALGAPNLGISASPPCHDQFSLDSIAVVAVFGGSAPYTYALSPLPTGTIFSTSGSFPAIWKNISFSSPGATFTVTVTDGFGCTRTSLKNLVNPSAINSLSTSQISPNCNGDSTGKICFSNAVGGTPLYSYTLSPSYSNTILTTSGTNCFEHLPAGTYTLTVTDANGCVSPNVKTITQPSAIAFNTSPLLIVKPTCPANCNGSYQPITTGGVGGKKFYKYPYIGPGPYDYADSVVSGVGPFNKFQNLCAGVYTILCKDALGCTKSTTIILTYQALQTSSTVTACGSYLWNGNTYTTSGALTQTYVSAFGCDSIHTINLTVNPLPSVHAISLTACNGTAVNLMGSPVGGVFSLPNPYTGPTTNYTYTFTDINGCAAASAPASITVSPCNLLLNLSVFIQGYALGLSNMTPVLLNQSASTSNSIVDVITVQLRQATAPYGVVDSRTAILQTTGNTTVSFNAPIGSYYIVVKHRNGLETWSANPVLFSSTTSYDFTNAANKAYGNNMVEVQPGLWAIYSGDLNFDQNIDLIDAGFMINDINLFSYGYYATDLNGDGNVDLMDLALLSDNISQFIYANFP